MVYKDITTVFTCNKAKTFAVVKPLHSSLCHFFYLLLYKLNLRRTQEKKPQSQKVFVACVIAKTSKIQLLYYHTPVSQSRLGCIKINTSIELQKNTIRDY